MKNPKIKTLLKCDLIAQSTIPYKQAQFNGIVPI